MNDVKPFVVPELSDRSGDAERSGPATRRPAFSVGDLWVVPLDDLGR